MQRVAHTLSQKSYFTFKEKNNAEAKDGKRMIEVVVFDNIEVALLRLKKETQKDGDLRLLKRRQDHPNLTDRRKIKAREAEGRRRQALKKRESKNVTY